MICFKALRLYTFKKIALLIVILCFAFVINNGLFLNVHFVELAPFQVTRELDSHSSPNSNEDLQWNKINNYVPRPIQFNTKKRYIRRPWSNDDKCANFTIRRTILNSQPRVALASYPGSGNTWVRYLIEGATGIYTGSVYKDANLYFEGFWGELADWNSGVTVVQKTHDFGIGHVHLFDEGSAIFLLRNPYEAVMSFHNFLYGGHKGYAPESNYQRKEWPAFVLHQVRIWLVTAINWIENSKHLIVIHYETVKENPILNLLKMLQFLQLPIEKGRLFCIKKYPNGKFQRRMKNAQKPYQDDIFSQEIRHIIDRAIRYINFLLKNKQLEKIPLQRYTFYNGTMYGVKMKREVTTKSTWKSSLWESYINWAPRLFSSLGEDPLTRILREASGIDFYKWNIQFDPAFPESHQLETDFNSGPPFLIQQYKHQKKSL